MEESLPKGAILLVGHGSTHPAAEETLAGVAAIVRSLVGAGTIVEHAYIAVCSPSFADGFERCVSAGARQVTVVPYFLSYGKHVAIDIPQLVQDAMARYPHITCRTAPPLGIHGKLAEVILERVDEATPVATRRPLRKCMDKTEGAGNEIQTQESL